MGSEVVGTLGTTGSMTFASTMTNRAASNIRVPPLVVPGEQCRDLREALRREWLETNGLGSFACGTVAGAATRRYHSLLCVATRPPVGRMVMVNNIEQMVLHGGETYQLSTNVYQGGHHHPEGYRLLEGFRLDPWPIWTWRIGNLTIERELFMPHGVQATVLRWRVRGGSVDLVLRPLLSGRDYHSTHHENPDLSTHHEVDGPAIAFQPYPSLPTVRVHHNGRYGHQPCWYRRFLFPVERERGLEHEEDLFAPGEFRFSLGEGREAEMVLTTEGRRRFEVGTLAETERNRRAQVVNSSLADVPKDQLDDTLLYLTRAADQFLVARAGGATVIAGYPWFTDWGRDTFISLPGLTLATKRYGIARELLASFAPWVSDGMIPNRFPDGGDVPEYNTVDAPLWYAVAVGQYLEASGDSHFVMERLWPCVRAIVDGYRRGTRYRIGVDQDGLVWAGAPGVQLTWMDARVGDWVVTPRIGKPIEIQALWLRTLRVAIQLAERAGARAWRAEVEVLERRTRESLRTRYWHEQGGYLYDVIDGEPPQDASLRPNQLYALALDPPALDPGAAEHALDAVEKHLLTPYGLRTLAPSASAYRGRCTGSPRDRDSAYHQGTVWPHLLGVYADAVWQVRKRRVGRRLVQGMRDHLFDAGLGQVSEVADGDSPHEPRGAFAQAWGVAELLRITLGG
jgi:predicted glycogen debranching enzyme